MKNTPTIFLLFVFVSFTGCWVHSDNHVHHDGSSINPSELLGTWRVKKVFDENAGTSDGNVDLVLSNLSGNSLDGVYKAGSETIYQIDVKITKIGTKKIVSFLVDDEASGWQFAEYKLINSNQTLQLFYPKVDTIIDDINASNLSGSVVSIEDAVLAATITASSAQLRTYISNNSSLFSATPFIEFDKQ